MADAPLHVVFGTGPLGTATARALLERRHAVRMVDRSGRRSAAIPAAAELIACDATDRDAARAAVAGAAAVYQCAQPPYTRWKREFPPLQAAILDAAAAADAKLIVAENTYMYGDTGGAPLREGLPHRATTRKGRVRAAMSEALFAAHREGRVRAAAARGSDFYGPGMRDSAFGERVFGPAVEGKPMQFIGRLDAPHSVTFIDDFGATLARLGEVDAALGRAWHVPNDRPTITPREFGERIAAEVGTPLEMRGMGRWMMRLGGIFIPEARETLEMMYEFEQPFVVESDDARRILGLEATPIDEGVAQTVAWYRAGAA